MEKEFWTCCFPVIVVTAIVGCVLWECVINPWLDRRAVGRSYFVRPKDRQ